jgi:acetyl-CoA carboxylase biotin carboxyl carrier protein
VADDNGQTPGPFDVQTVKLLVQLMNRHELTEIDLRQGEQRIRLRRGPQGIAVASPTMSVPVATSLTPAAPTAAQSAGGDKSTAPARKLLEIKSPTVGTFYAQEKEGAPAYVAVGSKVTPKTVVGLIEAMKLFNEVTAGCTGVIEETLVQNAQFVEFDTVLFRVNPAG